MKTVSVKRAVHGRIEEMDMKELISKDQKIKRRYEYQEASFESPNSCSTLRH